MKEGEKKQVDEFFNSMSYVQGAYNEKAAFEGGITSQVHA